MVYIYGSGQPYKFRRESTVQRQWRLSSRQVCNVSFRMPTSNSWSIQCMLSMEPHTWFDYEPVLSKDYEPELGASLIWQSFIHIVHKTIANIAHQHPLKKWRFRELACLEQTAFWTFDSSFKAWHLNWKVILRQRKLRARLLENRYICLCYLLNKVLHR